MAVGWTVGVVAINGAGADVAAGVVAFSEGFGLRSSWQRCPISRLMLLAVKKALECTKVVNSPSLTRSPFVASHMAPPAVQTRMINLPPLCRFLFLRVVVDGC